VLAVYFVTKVSRRPLASKIVENVSILTARFNHKSLTLTITHLTL